MWLVSTPTITSDPGRVNRPSPAPPTRSRKTSVGLHGSGCPARATPYPARPRQRPVDLAEGASSLGPALPHQLAGGRPPGDLGDRARADALVRALPPLRTLAADGAYDSDAHRAMLNARGARPVIPNDPCRKRVHPFDLSAGKRRNLVERAFCRPKDFRRIATRYDKLAATYTAVAATAALAAILTLWTYVWSLGERVGAPSRSGFLPPIRPVCRPCSPHNSSDRPRA
jgi:putative transposase